LKVLVSGGTGLLGHGFLRVLRGLGEHGIRCLVRPDHGLMGYYHLLDQTVRVLTNAEREQNRESLRRLAVEVLV
jgi:thioester reductase-like protein